MNRFSVRGAARCLGVAAMIVSVFEACSSADTSTPLPPSGEVSVSIDRILLGDDSIESGGASVIGCDATIGVVLSFGAGWTLRPPGVCSTAQCGPVRVTLSNSTGRVLLTRDFATAGVDLKLDRNALTAGDYVIVAQLLDNAGNPVVLTDAGRASAEAMFHLSLPTGCDSDSGTAGSSNDGTAGSTEGGAAGAITTTRFEAGSGGVLGEGGASASGAGGVSGS